MELVQDIWASLRPYLVKMVADAIIASLLWVFLWLFKGLTSIMPVKGWAGEVIQNVHSMGAVLAFAAFAVLFFWDVIKISQKEEGGH